jgi:hypothetical protein
VRWYHSVIYINYVQNNYMFRPCKRAIIRLFLEPVIRHIQWGEGDENSSYIIHVALKHMLQWGFPIIHYKDIRRYIPIGCSWRSPCPGRVLWQGVLCVFVGQEECENLSINCAFVVLEKCENLSNCVFVVQEECENMSINCLFLGQEECENLSINCVFVV